MSLIRMSTILTAILLSASMAVSQETTVFETTQLVDNIYKLSADGGGYTIKVIASIGEDGLLIIDSGHKTKAEGLKKALQSLGQANPDIIINTHSHTEHNYGNFALGRGAVIIGHTRLRERLQSGAFLFDEYPQYALPNITFADSMSLYFNGEEIKLIALPGAHDDCDIIAWFTKSNVACVGALCGGVHFPTVDNRGDVLNYAATAQKIIDMLPEDVIIIPGHADDCTLDDCRKFHEMLVNTEELVRRELARGKDLATMQQEDLLKDYEAFEWTFAGKDTWLEYLVKGIEKRNQGHREKKAIYEPIYRIIQEKGVEAAIEHYFRMKETQQDQYRFDEAGLVIMAYRYHQHEKYDKAIPFYRLCAEEYPEGKYNWFCYNNMADSYYQLGNNELAIENFKKSLELNPENTEAIEMLKKLEKK